MVTFVDVSSPRIVAEDLFSTLPNPTCAFVTECGLDLLDVWLVRSVTFAGVYVNASVTFPEVISPLMSSDDLFSTLPNPICAFVTLWGFDILAVWASNSSV